MSTEDPEKTSGLPVFWSPYEASLRPLPAFTPCLM